MRDPEALSLAVDLFTPHVFTRRRTIDVSRVEAPPSSAAATPRSGALQLARAPPHLTRAPSHRVAEFEAGRQCAAAALAAAGAQPPCGVGVGALGAPRWPDGFVGSIAHAGNIACAAAARAVEVRGLGIDVEPVFDEAFAREVLPVALGPEECALAASSLVCATAAFSAKESFLKCVSPLAGTLFDFGDARIVAFDAGGAFRIRLVRDLAPGFGRGLELAGRFGAQADHVFSGVELVA
jgi:enterobactin synthetase component D